MSEIDTSRRNLLYGIAAAGAAVPLIAACGSASDTPSGTGSNPSGGGSAPAGGATGEPAAGGGIPAGDIPVGGGAVYPDEQIVITQPSEGEFKAFSITCTHSGCAVNSVEDGTINCPCHGSKFSIEDGSVQDGPAPSGLAVKSVTVSGSSLTVS